MVVGVAMIRSSMTAVSLALVLSASSCGNGPALRNVPRPNPAVAAGVAAAAAALATAIDPDGAAKKPERDDPAAAETTGRAAPVPADVLDRLDEAEQQRAAAAEADAGSAQ
jgi:hypothetical protein